MVVADHSHRHERETLSDRFTFLLGWSGGAVLFETRDVACLADVTPLQTRLGAEAVADAARMRGSDGKFHYNATIRELDKRAGQLKAQAITTAGNAREKVLDIARHAATDGTDPVQTAAGRRRDARREAAGEIAAQPPWPALVDRRLLWWPAADYDRLVRQVPDIAGILGGPWRELESFMTAADTPGSTEPLLAHADFTKFTAYLENIAADPRLSPVQTAFTRHAGAGYHCPAHWPPGRRYPCWSDRTGNTRAAAAHSPPGNGES
jgi:hypothetical protein